MRDFEGGCGSGLKASGGGGRKPLDRPPVPGSRRHPLRPVKSHFRLEYERLADALRHHRLIEAEALRLTLHQCLSTGALFPDVLVRDGLVSDWELSRLCCETFNLPFLPIEAYQPDKKLLDGIDVEYLRQYGLVPLDGFEELLTVSMPGMVPTDVLTGLAEMTGKQILPVVGTVQGNHTWLERNLPPPAALQELKAAAEGGEWTGIFDAGDAAVQLGRADEDGGQTIELDSPMDLDELPPARPADDTADAPAGTRGLRLQGDEPL